VARGSCDFSVKVTNAQNANALGVILYNDPTDTFESPGGLSNTYIPTVMITNAQGVAVKSFIDANPGQTATMDPNGLEQTGLTPDQLVGFSSIGPALGSNAIKPDLVAIAGNEDLTTGNIYNSIYMGTQSYDPYGEIYSSNRYVAADGTSFATPMVSGSAAMFIQHYMSLHGGTHPTVAQVRSALINNAAQSVTTDDSDPAIPVDVQWVGGGLLDADATLKATVEVYPASVSFGALNLPALPSAQTLTLTNNGSSAVNLTLAATSNEAGAVSLNKSSLSLTPGASGSVSVQIGSSAPSAAGEYSGAITIQGTGVSLRVPWMYFIADGTNAEYPNIIPLTGGYCGGSGSIIDQCFDGTVNGGASDGIFFAFLVTDDFGIPIPNAQVSWSESGGSLTSVDSVTNAYGIATAVPVVPGQVGSYNYTASVNSLGLQVEFTVYARAVPTIRASNGILNAASFTLPGNGIAPGSYIALFGSGLSDVVDMSYRPMLPLGLGTELEGFGTFVSFDVPSDGISAPGHMTYMSPGQVNVQVPWELQSAVGSDVQIKDTIDFSYGNLKSIPVVAYSPAFFTVDSNSDVAALDLKYHVISSANPAVPGDVVQLFANGLGPVTNQPASGSPASSTPFSKTTTTPVVKIGTQEADVTCSSGCFSGLAPGFAGLYQINAVVPAGLAAGTYPITVTIGGVTSPTANIQVK